MVRLCGLVGAILFAAALTALAEPSFQGLGRVGSFSIPGNYTTPGGYTAWSQAFDVSADGSVVVGQATDLNGRYGAFRWSTTGGMQGIPYSYYVTSMPGAVGVSPDGLVLVGNAFTTYYSYYNPTWRAYRWRVGDSGITFLGSVFQLAPSDEYTILSMALARKVAGDSLNTVVGSATFGDPASPFGEWATYPLAWRSGNGTAFTFYPARAGSAQEDCPDECSALSLSRDGAWAVGYGVMIPQGGSCDTVHAAARWPMVGFLPEIILADGDGGSEARAVSNDGSIIAGTRSIGTARMRMYRWTAGGGAVDLAAAPSAATGISANGDTVVGWRIDPATGGERAVIWTAARGVEWVDERLGGEGVSAAGWTLSRATAVSADGLTIVGYGTDPAGHVEAWRAVPGCSADYNGNGLIEPSDVSLFVAVWFSSLSSGTLQGDFDHNGHVEPADVSMMVGRWFAALTSGGC